MMAVLAQAWSILLLFGYRVDFTDSFQWQSSALQPSRRRCHSNNNTTNNKGRSAVKIRLNVCYYSNDGSSSDLFQTNNYNNNLANPYTNRQYFESISNSNSDSNNEDEYYNKILDAVGRGGSNGVGIGSGSSAAATGGNRNSRQTEEEDDDDDGKKKEEDEPPLRFVRDSMINSVTMFPWMFLIAADKITNKYCYNQAQKDMIELEHYILRTTDSDIDRKNRQRAVEKLNILIIQSKEWYDGTESIKRKEKWMVLVTVGNELLALYQQNQLQYDAQQDQHERRRQQQEAAMMKAATQQQQQSLPCPTYHYHQQEQHRHRPNTRNPPPFSGSSTTGAGADADTSSMSSISFSSSTNNQQQQQQANQIMEDEQVQPLTNSNSNNKEQQQQQQAQQQQQQTRTQVQQHHDRRKSQQQHQQQQQSYADQYYQQQQSSSVGNNYLDTLE